jgi:hypothetical protein
VAVALAVAVLAARAKGKLGAGFDRGAVGPPRTDADAAVGDLDEHVVVGLFDDRHRRWTGGQRRVGL